MSRAATTRDRTREAVAPPAPRPSAADRRRRREHSRRHRMLRLLLLVPLLATVAWAVWASPLLGVRAVQVDGAVSLRADEVRAAAGIADGTPLLRVDVAAVQSRIARLPQVAAVEVTRGWPDRIVVTLTERVPLAVVGAAGQRTLVDADGVLFDTITGDPPAGVVPLDVPSPGPGDPATAAGLSALAALPADVRTRITEVSARTGDDVTLTLADGTTVLWGDGEDSAAKGEALAALLAQLDAGALDPATTIDVSAPDAVVLR